MTTFQQPATAGGYFKPADTLGHLVLFTAVHKVERAFDQLRGEEIDQAVVDVVDLDGDQQLEENMIVTHGGLVRRLPAGATMVLGRIGQFRTNRGNDMYVLDPYIEGADDARAQAWLDARPPATAFAQPTETPRPQASPPPSTPAAGAPDPAMVAAAIANLTPAQRQALGL